ncbi:uncharacterized protein LOC125231207 [Leguminivora glycinivorella]|uniref:uncharacterized protein LOC125231207 n=1 Tax=Leguminivora glycinivorella TaxID=1035111 RepID=UPI00200EE84F|nr:uncharacterized protein LOC125231207 [Leguminivora glycinivorella]
MVVTLKFCVCMCRFGLQYCDLPTMLSNVATLLRPMALDIDGKGTPIVFVVLLVVAVIVYFYVYVVSVAWFVFWRETEDLVAVMVILSLGIASIICVVKMFSLHLNSKRARKAFVAYLAFDKRIHRDSRMYQNLLKTLRIVKRRAIFVWVLMINNGLIYVVKPHLLPGKHLIEDLQVIYGLEPMYESPNFELAHILVGTAVMLLVYAAGNIGCLLFVMTGYIEAQMTALSQELLHLWPDAQALTFEDVRNEKKLRNKYIKQQLEFIVQAHAANLALLRLTGRIFSNSIAVEFCLLAVSLIVELLGGLENTYLQIPFALTQVSMDCFTGQRLIDASITFKEAVYDCKWENFDVQNMKLVFVILQNSQTMVLSAGGIAELRYTSLMTVIRTIYSGYAALRSTMHGEKPKPGQ